MSKRESVNERERGEREREREREREKDKVCLFAKFSFSPPAIRHFIPCRGKLECLSLSVPSNLIIYLRTRLRLSSSVVF